MSLLMIKFDFVYDAISCAFCKMIYTLFRSLWLLAPNICTGSRVGVGTISSEIPLAAQISSMRAHKAPPLSVFVARSPDVLRGMHKPVQLLLGVAITDRLLPIHCVWRLGGIQILAVRSTKKPWQLISCKLRNSKISCKLRN